MEIKGAYNLYAAQQTYAAAAQQKAGAAEAVGGSAAKKAAGGASDTVTISAEGAFRSQLQQAEAPYEASYTDKASASPERIAQLKAAYAGEQCPPSAQQIAGAMLASVAGTQV